MHMKNMKKYEKFICLTIFRSLIRSFYLEIVDLKLIKNQA